LKGRELRRQYQFLVLFDKNKNLAFKVSPEVARVTKELPSFTDVDGRVSCRRHKLTSFEEPRGEI